ncbi:MAG: PQQ-dependent sugar dehydrogenase [Acidimicrobiia bacterium]|nr:MAG: PQQ-dependent sugar dehydrogenase [Acidimicrobiia bacterium]
MSGLLRVAVLSMSLGVGVVLSACSGNAPAPTSAPPILSTTSSLVSTTTPSVTSTAGRTTTTVAVTTTTVSLEDLVLSLAEVDSGFSAPVFLTADPAGGPDLVVEQAGRIVRSDGGDHEVVLDIRDDVRFDGEQGLLGLAFHPRFSENSLAYVNYVDNSGTTVIEELTIVDGVFDVASRRRILTIDQPAPNHNGGMIAFGPDGYLWIGMGDGGGANDEFGNGQRVDTLLSAMLRIAVGIEGVDTYAIPANNPYADGVGGAPEVWAIGLRNPWRFSFDGQDVWIADVGQDEIEEINVVPVDVRALNFGWAVMEGSSCFRSATCDRTPYVEPVVEYDHGQGCSITGGYVYRGDAIPEIQGLYFYSDFCSGFLRSYSAATADIDWTPLTGTIPAVSSFGAGGDGELYVVSLSGSIFKLEARR